jgi:transposase
MELLAKGFLPTSYQPTAADRALRERLRWRAQLVRTCTKFKNRLHALLDKENKGFESPFSVKGRKRLSEVELLSERAELVGEHLNVIDFFDSVLDNEAAWIRNLTTEMPEAGLLKSVPGVGDIVSLMYIAEVGDVSRFRNAVCFPWTSAVCILQWRKASHGSDHQDGMPTTEMAAYSKRVGRNQIVRWFACALQQDFS